MEGWIKLHRQIFENELYFQDKFTRGSAWIDLLLLANHKSTSILVRGIEISLHPGDLFYSQEELAMRWKWSRKKVKKFLKTLENKNQITYKVYNRIGITSIVNWSKYQEKDTTEDTTKGTTEERQKSDKRHSNKNDNNVKNEKKVTKVTDDTGIEKVEKEDKRDTRINELIEFLQEKAHLAVLDGTIKQNRFNAYNLLRKLKKLYPEKDELKLAKDLILIGLQDQYIGSQMTSIGYVFYNIQKIILSFQKNQNQNTVFDATSK